MPPSRPHAAGPSACARHPEEKLEAAKRARGGAQRPKRRKTADGRGPAIGALLKPKTFFVGRVRFPY